MGSHTETLVSIPKPKFSGILISIPIPNQIFGNPEIVLGFRDKSGIPKWFWAVGLKFDILCFWAKI